MAASNYTVFLYNQAYVINNEQTKRLLTWSDFLQALYDPTFAELFSSFLLSHGENFFLECNPISSKYLDTTVFQCAVVPAPQLSTLKANPKPFIQHFSQLNPQEKSVVAFTNLSNDAYLVAPYSAANASWDFAHLGRFLKTVPLDFIHLLWQRVAQTMYTALNNNPGNIWLSTHGLGVSWLHVRLSIKPKYYQHTAFTTI